MIALSNFEIYQTATLAGWASLGLARALLVSRRGVQIVAVDSQRTTLEMTGDALLAAVVLLWLYLAFAYPWELPTAFIPAIVAKKYIDTLVLKMIGAACLAAGVGLYAAGVWALGDAWRLGIDHDNPGPLTTRGVFRLSRNPIYVGIGLLMLGVTLIEGRPVFLALSLVYGLLIHWTIRREERFLNKQYGDQYQAYCRRVARYLTFTAIH